MAKDRTRQQEGLDVARARIAAEQVARTGRLDLGNLGLVDLPSELWKLDRLETLSLGGVVQAHCGLTYRSEYGSSDYTDEPFQPNHLDDLADIPLRFPQLRHLNCSGTALSDLTPLAGLTSLQQLDLTGTQVTDLSPLTGLGALRQLALGDRQTGFLWSNPLANIGPLAALSALEQLNLSGTQVTDISPLASLSALQELDLKRTKVTDLGPLDGLSALRRLELGHEYRHFHTECTPLADLGPLTTLTSLQYLSLCGTQVVDLAPLAKLTALQQLYLGSLRIAEPLSVGCSQLSNLAPLVGLIALQRVGVTQTQVTDLGPLAGLSTLQQLDLELTPVTDLRPLVSLSALQKLSLRSTSVTDLRPLAGLSALQELSLEHTSVTDLRPLANLSALQKLSLDDTPVTDLRPLAGLSTLQRLDLSETPVANLGPLASLSALQGLDLSKTQVTDLGPLANLSTLQRLKLWQTQVTDLDPLASLSALQELDLWETSSLNGVSEPVVVLPRLERLLVNPQPGLGDIPGEVLSRDVSDNCLPRLRAHVADLAGGAKPLRDLKVIVIGNGRVGKTQLCRRLRGEPFEADSDSTHGISVTSMDLSLPGYEETAVLNLWDFGGQDLYHGTHALFMRTRAIFLLVWSPESEQGAHTHSGVIFRNQPLPYWLEYIRHLGAAKSPVILVQTRCDGALGECPTLPVDERFLQPLLADSRFFKRVSYSAQDDSGRSSLTEALQQAVIHLRKVQGRPQIGQGRLAVWEQLRAWRDVDAKQADPGARRRRLLGYGDFAELCAQHRVTSPETFVEVLHHAGVVFYHSGLFEDHLILDQSWALDAVYAVFTREGAVYETLRHLGGRFTRPLLDSLLWRARGLSADDQRSLIGVMEVSGVCFVHRPRDDPDETEYVAPDLLPEGRTGPPSALAGELAARWDPIPGDPLTASLRYPFLLPSVGRAVLSELGQLGGDTALYWRYGLCLYDAESKASAVLDAVADANEATAQQTKPGYGGRLRLRVKGEGAERLLVALIERLQKLNQERGWPSELEDSESKASRPHTCFAAASASDGSGLRPMHLADPPAEPPLAPEVYVSFAWKQDRAEPLVDDLISGLAEHGIQLLRDSDQLQPGDSISRFMKRLSAGRCVLLVISEAYLRSPFCMTELHGIWVNTRQRGDLFRKRIVPLVQTDAAIGSPQDRIAHAAYWKQQYEEIDALIEQHGREVIGIEDFRRLKLIGDFYRSVGDLLSFADDVLVPRDRQTLSHDTFAVVRDLIKRALER